MTREEAIEAIKCNWPDSRYTILREALDMAISALRQQEHFREVTKKVEPLTLDELREAAQTGDPVWLVRANCSSWVVIEKVGDRKYLPCVDYAEFGSDEPYDFAISDYGDSFKAYRQKPEEGDGMSKPMSDQMQKLAARYEKATGKKFGVRTNADRIRAMSDEELAEFLWDFNLADVSTVKMGEFGPHMFRYRLKEWLQQPAEEDKHEP